MRQNLVSINEMSQQEALKKFYSREMAEDQKIKAAKLWKVSLMYNPSICIIFVCIYRWVGLKQYYYYAEV